MGEEEEREAQAIEGVLLTDNQEIDSVLSTIGKKELIHEVTGVIVRVSNGDYRDVWITFSNRPYLANALYEKIYPV